MISVWEEKIMKRFAGFLLALSAAFGLCLQPVRAAGTTFGDIGAGSSDIIVLYTNDVHGGISDNAGLTGTSSSLGYAGIAAVRAEAQAQAAGVLLVDNGDSIQGAVFDTLSDGTASMDLMEKLGYDLCIPGNHEFDFGVDTFLDEVKNHPGLEYICANFTDMDGNFVLSKGYEVKDFEVDGSDVKIAFVGLDTPESISKGTPTYFMEDDGQTYKYTFNADTPEDFYAYIQKTVDQARTEADYVIVMGHIGDEGVTDGWSSPEIIENTDGIDVFLDGHAHSVIAGEQIENKDGEEVLLTSTGTKLENIGCLKLTVADGKISAAESHLIDTITDEEKSSEAYQNMASEVSAVEDQYAYLAEVVGHTDYDLKIYDPSDSSVRLVRTRDCNMADFLTDGYVWASSNLDGFEPADLSLLNGGSIRADILSGDVTYTSVLTVFPWYTHVTEIKATGQQIVDCLEMGARKSPEECGGFMVGGNLSYQINLSKESKVSEDSQGMFLGVDGSYENGDYRVSNVLIGGEPVDLEKEYLLVINDYYYTQCGDGMTMFQNDEAIVNGDDNVIDVELMCSFFKSLENEQVPDTYSNPYGDGRITVIADAEAAASETADSGLLNALTSSDLGIKEKNTAAFDLSASSAVLNSDNLYCVRIAKDQLPASLQSAANVYAVSQADMSPVLCSRDGNGDLLVPVTDADGSVVLGTNSSNSIQTIAVVCMVILLIALIAAQAADRRRKE